MTLDDNTIDIFLKHEYIYITTNILDTTGNIQKLRSRVPLHSIVLSDTLFNAFTFETHVDEIDITHSHCSAYIFPKLMLYLRYHNGITPLYNSKNLPKYVDEWDRWFIHILFPPPYRELKELMEV